MRPETTGFVDERNGPRQRFGPRFDDDVLSLRESEGLAQTCRATFWLSDADSGAIDRGKRETY